MKDDELRSMLTDAEVRPPRRVWRNIASRLDEASPAPSQYGWMKWAGAALAFSVLVAGVLIPTYSNITEAPVAQVSPVMDEPEPEVLIHELELPVSGPGQSTAVLPAGRRTRPLSSIPSESKVAEIVLPEEEDVVETIAAEEGKADKEEGVSAPEKRTSRPSTNPNADVFAAMAFEDSKAFRPHAKALYAQGSIGGNDSDISFFANKARMASGTAIEKTGIKELGESVYGIPFSLGLGVRFYVLPRLSFGTGLNYSLLSRTFEGKYQEVDASGNVGFSETGSVHHMMHYIGIPVNAFFDIISGEKVRFYVYGGGEAEYCVSNKYTLYSTKEDIVYRSPVSKLQWSVGAGLGVEFRLSDHIGLYLDPSARYYFHCEQPKNVRTERPLMANFNAGLRFDF